MTTSPVAPRRPHTHTAHGVKRDDPWSWLRDENWREVMRDPSVLDADIRAYLDSENDWTKARLADVEALQTDLFEELKARIKPDDSSPPVNDGPWRYNVRYEEKGEHRSIAADRVKAGPKKSCWTATPCQRNTPSTGSAGCGSHSITSVLRGRKMKGSNSTAFR